jgi:hypothetical protein
VVETITFRAYKVLRTDVNRRPNALSDRHAGRWGAGGIPKSKYQMSAVLTEDPSFIIATLRETFVSGIKTTDVTLYLVDPQY